MPFGFDNVAYPWQVFKLSIPPTPGIFLFQPFTITNTTDALCCILVTALKGKINSEIVVIDNYM